MKKEYFHEITRADFNKLIKKKMTYGELAKKHPQPKWCGYPNATEGVMGCWSLMDFKIKSEDGCKKCDLYWKMENGKPIKELK